MCINPFLVVRCDGTSWWAPSVSARIFPEAPGAGSRCRCAGARGETARPGSAVHVGTDTPWVSKQLEPAEDPAAARAEYIAFQPAGRLLSTEQVSGAIAYLASPLSGWTAVTVLAVDGGMHGLRLRPPARL
jgi:hypothetical protein